MSHTTQGNKTSTQLSKKDYWETTQYALNDALYLCGLRRFELDIAASTYSAKAINFYSETDDALSDTRPWGEYTLNAMWCNPPFSLKTEFLDKAYSQRKQGLICMMIPYEPCTKWWRKYVDGRASVVFVPDGRYNFIDPETRREVKGVNFCSCFVVFNSLNVPTQYVNFERGVGNE